MCISLTTSETDSRAGRCKNKQYKVPQIHYTHLSWIQGSVAHHLFTDSVAYAGDMRWIALQAALIADCGLSYQPVGSTFTPKERKGIAECRLTVMQWYITVLCCCRLTIQPVEWLLDSLPLSWLQRRHTKLVCGLHLHSIVKYCFFVIIFPNLLCCSCPASSSSSSPYLFTCRESKKLLTESLDPGYFVTSVFQMNIEGLLRVLVAAKCNIMVMVWYDIHHSHCEVMPIV